MKKKKIQDLKIKKDQKIEKEQQYKLKGGDDGVIVDDIIET